MIDARLPAPWEPVDGERAESLDHELQCELPPGHILEGRDSRAMAARCDCDDVLFEVDGGKAFAIVHLAWARERERGSGWPATRIIGSWEACLAEMRIDNVEYNAGGA